MLKGAPFLAFYWSTSSELCQVLMEQDGIKTIILNIKSTNIPLPPNTLFLSRREAVVSSKDPPTSISRIIRAIAAVGSILLARETILRPEIAFGEDLRILASEQTIEDAESKIKSHAVFAR